MMVETVWCEHCGCNRTVERRLNVSIDGTTFYQKPESVVITGIQTTFGCNHIATVWDATPSAML